MKNWNENEIVFVFCETETSTLFVTQFSHDGMLMINQ